MENDKEIILQKGGYRDLIAFQKATCIYDITYYFAHKFLERTDRTVDQMDTGCAQRQTEYCRGQCGGNHLTRNGAETDQCGESKSARTIAGL